MPVSGMPMMRSGVIDGVDKQSGVMMSRLKYATLAFMLSGCAAQLLSAGERTLVIKTRSDDVESAQTLADSECKKRGLHARLSIKASPEKYIFDCIE
jgi:hypothetical protein